MNTTRARLINVLISKFNFTKFNAEILVENFFDQICVALARGDAIKIHGFGNFTLRDKK
jgi:integration host factor subunit alpha